MNNMKTKKKLKLTKQGKIIVSVISLMLLVVLGFLVKKILNPKVYDNQHFNYSTVKSNVDFNDNGIDDYTDFLNGALKDARNRPKYDGSYVSENNGYPPEDRGVCSDLVWRAFLEAGYSLRDMVNLDIKDNFHSYAGTIKKPDPHIDFRRVRNLKIFFDRHAVKLGLIPNNNPEIWQAGDIVIFGSDYNHIGILSNKRNASGIPYLLHNAGQRHREEDALLSFGVITGHYRFDASQVNSRYLIPFNSND